MAARRMGFLNMFEALASVDDFRTGFLEGNFAPTRFFTHDVLPLVTAQQKGDKFAAAKLVRGNSPLLSKESLKGNEKPIAQLRSAQAAIDSLMSLWADGGITCAMIAENIASTNLFVVPDSLKAALAAKNASLAEAPDAEEAPSLADFMLGPQIEFFAQTPEWEPLTAGNRNIVQWFERFDAIPAMQATTWEKVAQMAQAA